MHWEKICLWQRWRSGWNPFWDMILNNCDISGWTSFFDGPFTRRNKKQLSSIHPNSLSDCLKFLIKDLNVSNQICPVPLTWDHIWFLSQSSMLLFILFFCAKTLAEKLGVGWDGKTAKLSCSLEEFEIRGKNFSPMAVDRHRTWLLLF